MIRNISAGFAMLFSFSLVLFANTAFAEDKLIIGTKVAPPFVIKQENGEFTGISIELWRELARRLQIQYEFKEVSLSELMNGLSSGDIDVSVAALTVTPERENKVDFTHPFHTTGLAIAVTKKTKTTWDHIKNTLSWDFLLALGSLLGLLLFVGGLLWLVERKKNQAMFGGSAAEGIGSSFWWAAVTMTTVGYGDKAPITFLGRVIGLVWMFAAIILISSFTAAIATSLTVNRLGSSIQNLGDLPNATVATVSDSASAAFLDEHGIAHLAAPKLEPLFDSLAQGSIDAMVYDKPILQYVIKQSYGGQLQILPNDFGRQDYAIALPQGSDKRERFNQELLDIITGDRWEKIMDRYLGRSM